MYSSGPVHMTAGHCVCPDTGGNLPFPGYRKPHCFGFLYFSDRPTPVIQWKSTNARIMRRPDVRWTLSDSVRNTSLVSSVSLCTCNIVSALPALGYSDHKCEQRTDNGLHSSGYSSAATMAEDYRLISLLQKITNIRQKILSGRTGITRERKQLII